LGDTRSVKPHIYRYFDAEVLGYCAQPPPGFTVFSTAYAALPLYGTPLDTDENIKETIHNIRPQLELLYSWLHIILNTDILVKLPTSQPESHWGTVKAPKPGVPLIENHAQFYTANISVVVWNATKAWYMPPPKYDPEQTILIVNARTAQWNKRRLSVIVADEQGRAISIGNVGGRAYYAAYVIDGIGRVICAPDYGRFAATSISDPTRQMIFCPGPQKQTEQSQLLISVFKCGSMVIFDYLEPNCLDIAIRTPLTISLRCFETHTKLDFYSTVEEYRHFGYSIAMAFIEPDVPFEAIILAEYLANRPYMVLNNATEEKPLGTGYKVKMGEQLMISGIFEFSKALHYLNSFRYQSSEPIMPIKTYQTAREHLNNLQREIANALESYQYTKAYNLAVEAWKAERDAYANVRGVIEDAVNTVPFFAAIVIIFAFLCEKLFFSFEGWKRLCAIIGIWAFCTLLFFLVHPGFLLASCIGAVIVSFAILALVTPTFGVIVIPSS